MGRVGGPVDIEVEEMVAVRALLVYESMFGSTGEVARSVAEGLTEGGCEVEVHEVRSAPAAGAVDFDVLVVGAPTHAFSLSRPTTRRDAVRQGADPGLVDTGLRDWLESLGRRDEARGRPAAAFDTRVTKVRNLPKAASTRAAHMLRRHGYELVTRPAPFLVDDVQGPLLDGELDRARAWGHEIAAAVTSASTAAS